MTNEIDSSRNIKFGVDKSYPLSIEGVLRAFLIVI